MRNLPRLNLWSVKSTQNWKCNFFPNQKLNYTSEILLWYYLFMFTKQLKLKKNQSLLSFEIYQTNLNLVKIRLICHEFRAEDEIENYFEIDVTRKKSLNLFKKLFGLKQLNVKEKKIRPAGIFSFLKKKIFSANLISHLKQTKINNTVQKKKPVFDRTKILLYSPELEKEYLEEFECCGNNDPYTKTGFNKKNVEWKKNVFFHNSNKKMISLFLKDKSIVNQIILKKSLSLCKKYTDYRYVNNINNTKNTYFVFLKKKISFLSREHEEKEMIEVIHNAQKLLYNDKHYQNATEDASDFDIEENKIKFDETEEEDSSSEDFDIEDYEQESLDVKEFSLKKKNLDTEDFGSEDFYTEDESDSEDFSEDFSEEEEEEEVDSNCGLETTQQSYFLIKQKLNLVLNKLLSWKTGISFEIKINFLITFSANFKSFLNDVVSEPDELEMKLANPNEEIFTDSWEVYKLLPYKRYSNVKVLVDSLEEIIGAKRSRQNYLHRAEKMEEKGKGKKTKNRYMWAFNLVHNQIESQKRKNLVFVEEFQKLIIAMKPASLDFVFMRLNGKIDSMSRAQTHCFKYGNQLAMRSKTRQVLFEQIPISARIGAFGLNLIAGKETHFDSRYKF